MQASRVPVYDRDAHAAVRNQGGSLELHEDDGQVAPREAVLIDQSFELARPEGQEMRHLDPSGQLHNQHLPAEGELFKPEIDRGQLRDLLLDSLQPGTVRWNHAVTGLSGPDEGPRHLHFADGGSLRVYIIRRLPHWITAEGLSTDDTGGIRERLLDRFSTWSPQMLQLITDNDGPYVDRPLFALPVPHTWNHSASVTLLGDAAHLMPPLGVPDHPHLNGPQQHDA